MPALLLYLLKFSCSIGILWLFYRLVLHSLTFYNWNRWCLLGYSLLCFLIPFINIGPIDKEDPALQPLVIQYIPVIGNPAPVTAKPETHPAIFSDPWNILLVVLTLGSIFLLARFLLRCYSLRKLRRRAVLLQEGPIKIFRVTEQVSPFSFGNAIYVNIDQHTTREWEEIILHEYVHIRQRHTLDIFFGELLIIANWYNPFAWLIRYSIRQNLEFIADRAVLETGRDKKGYQYHLLKVVGQTRYQIANNFNFSSLKKRIIMMNKMKSTRLHLLRFLFILPLLTVLLVAFRDRFPGFHTRQDLFVNAAGIVINSPSRTPIAGVTVKELVTGLQTTTDNRGFYKFRIPVKSDSVHISIEYSKPGYMGSRTDQSWHYVTQSKGYCDIWFMQLEANPDNGIYTLASPREEPPVDPTYEDALRGLKGVEKLDVIQKVTASIQKAHPEISLWYFPPGPVRSILVHTDGTVERYGYPGTPPFSAMGDKYGPEYFLMLGNTPAVNNNYLSRWAAISARAQMDFHTAAPNVKTILFPGDSRVIVVPISGRPKIYNMEDPKDIPAFESGYGPLPACVPRPATRSTPQPAAQTDTVPPKPHTTQPDDHHDILFAPGVTISTNGHAPLYIVDGVIKEQGVGDLNPMDIESITVLKDRSAKAIYGERGINGAILISTKNAKPVPLHVVGQTTDSTGQPWTIIADTIRTPLGKFYAEPKKPDF